MTQPDFTAIIKIYFKKQTFFKTWSFIYQKGGETLETSAYIPLTEKTSTNADVDMNVLGVIASESSVNVLVELTRNDGKDFPERFEIDKW